MAIPEIFSKITHGVYVVTVALSKALARGEEDHLTEGRGAFTAAWLTQASFDPLLLALSVNHSNYSYKLLQDSNICTINVLQKDRIDLVTHFGSAPPRGQHKLDKVPWTLSRNGSARLEDSLAFFDCKVLSYTLAGDHTLVLLKVEDAGIISNGEPLLYRDVSHLDGSATLFPKSFSKL